ncbi:MAG: hypothetical protein ACJA0N_002591 [Pseudohongiellaceae bacterium]|jgi:hypothetical protein
MISYRRLLLTATLASVLLLCQACSQDVSTQTTEDIIQTANDAPQATSDAMPKNEQPSVIGKAVLDLSLPDDSASNNTILAEEKTQLPNLFDEKITKKNISVDGGILREAENEDIIDSINGAEISISTKIE